MQIQNSIRLILGENREREKLLTERLTVRRHALIRVDDTDDESVIRYAHNLTACTETVRGINPRRRLQHVRFDRVRNINVVNV